MNTSGSKILLQNHVLGKRDKVRCLVVFQPRVAVVRIEEHGHNIGRIEVGDLVILT